MMASGLVSPPPVPLTGSFCMTPVIVIDAGSLGEVTPTMRTGTMACAGGHSRFGLAWASEHTGGAPTSSTVMVTPAAALDAWPSLTTSAKRRVAPPAPTAGAVNVGCALDGDDSTTAGPSICVHA